MLSPSEMDFVKHGGHEVYALAQSRDGERTLKEKLSHLDLERARSIRELEINRMKFLKSHHNLVPKTVIIHRGSAKLDLQRKIENAKEDQRQCQASLAQRKDAFMDALKKRPLSNNITTRSKQVARLEALRMEDEKNAMARSLPDYTLHSHDMALFQQSFQMTNQNHKKREQPFLNSVNVILESLKGERKQTTLDRRHSRQDKFDSLTRHILSTYAGISVEDGRRESEENGKDVEKTDSTEKHRSSQITNGNRNAEHEVTDNTQSIKHAPRAECSSNTESNAVHVSGGGAITNKATSSIENNGIYPGDESDDSSENLSNTHLNGQPNKALQMWASVQQEQRAAKMKRLQEEKTREKSRGRSPQAKTNRTKMQSGQVDVSIQVIPPARISRRLSPSYGKQPISDSLPLITKSTVDDNDRGANMRSPQRNDGSLSPKSPSSPGSPRLQLSVNNFKSEEDSELRSRVHSWSSGQRSRPESLSLYSQRRSSVGSRPLKKSFPHTLPPPVETPPTCSNTVVIVHDDISEKMPRRRSIFSVDKDDIHKEGSNDDLIEGENISRASSASENTSHGENPSTVVSNDNSPTRIQNGRPADVEKLGYDDLAMHLETSSCSARSESTIASLVNDRARSTALGTREGSGAGRRMSVQTQGALRLWASVQRQEADAEDGADGTAYQSAVESIVEAAAGVDHQVQRLEHVRRSSLTRYPLDLYRRPSLEGADDKSIEKLRMRRGSVSEPSKGTADVRDEVYKFLQKKFSTSELRRMSLSSAEGQFHSGTTLEDITGRRSSMSQSGLSQSSSKSKGSSSAQHRSPSAKTIRFNEQSAFNQVKKLTAAMDSVRGSSLRRPCTADTTPSNLSRASPSVNSRANSRAGPPSDSNFKTDVSTHEGGRSYSWAPDVSNTQDWHILALELLARNRQGVAKFHTVRGLLQGLADEYRKQTASMMYEELHYCTYLRVPNRLLPPDLKDSDVSSIFEHSM